MLCQALQNIHFECLYERRDQPPTRFFRFKGSMSEYNASYRLADKESREIEGYRLQSSAITSPLLLFV